MTDLNYRSEDNMGIITTEYYNIRIGGNITYEHYSPNNVGIGSYCIQCATRHINTTTTSSLQPTHLIKMLKESLIKIGENIECPICLDEFVPNNIEITDCGHMYCSTCKNHITTCAVCRHVFR